MLPPNCVHTPPYHAPFGITCCSGQRTASGASVLRTSMHTTTKDTPLKLNWTFNGFVGSVTAQSIVESLNSPATKA